MVAIRNACVLVGLALVVAVQHPTQAALVLRYSFDEASGVALDSGTGTAANGVFSTAAARTSDTPSGTGKALNASVLDAYVGAAGATKLDNLSQITVTFWIKSVAAHTVNSYLFGKSHTGLKARFPAFGSIDNRITPGVHNNMEFSGGDSPSWDLSSWTFIALTLDGTITTGNVKWYKGDAATSVTAAAKTVNSGATFTSGTFANDFRVGHAGTVGSGRTIGAYMDDFRVYNTVLTASEVDAVRLEAITLPATGTVILLR